MPEPTIADLLARIAALEQELHEQRRMHATLQVEVSGLLRTPFRLFDDAGKVVLEVVRSGPGARLRLRNTEGHFLVTLAELPSGGSIAIHNRAGAEVVGLAAGRHGGNLSISSEAGQIVGWMNVTASGGHVVTRDPAGKVTSQLPTTGIPIPPTPLPETAPEPEGSPD